ncbi:MAG: hypothetical protein V3T59_03750 [Desulfobacterales bacterium]
MSPERSEVEFFNFSVARSSSLILAQRALERFKLYPRLVRKFRRWSIGTYL